MSLDQRDLRDFQVWMVDQVTMVDQVEMEKPENVVQTVCLVMLSIRATREAAVVLVPSAHRVLLVLKVLVVPLVNAWYPLLTITGSVSSRNTSTSGTTSSALVLTSVPTGKTLSEMLRI